MDYQNTLPFAGAGTIVIGGAVVQQLWLPVIAIAVVALFAFGVRLWFRRGKRATDG